LGRDLTSAEKSAIVQAATTRDAAIQAAIATQRTEVAAIFGLSTTDLDTKIQTYLQANPRAHHLDPRALLAAALGRPLTDAETAALTAAAQKRDDAVTAAIDAYRTAVAGALSMSVADLDAKVTLYLLQHPDCHDGSDSQPGTGGGDSAGGGHHGHPGPGAPGGPDGPDDEH